MAVQLTATNCELGGGHEISEKEKKDFLVKRLEKICRVALKELLSYVTTLYPPLKTHNSNFCLTSIDDTTYS
jgi:hypothetical protein